jgi:hypothetical protein|eukprot:COSAG06_NODE_4873_length_3889_cov_10.023320_4_plen_62_part_00
MISWYHASVSPAVHHRTGCRMGSHPQVFLSLGLLLLFPSKRLTRLLLSQLLCLLTWSSAGP